MRIEQVNTMNTAGMMTGNSLQGGDAVTRSIQNQIAATQKELQELSKDESLTQEEKMKKRQELNQKLTELNNQLRQHQTELRRQQQSQKTATEQPVSEKGAADSSSALKEQPQGLSQASMQAMLSADSSIKLAQVQGSTITELKGRTGVLKGEIKQDSRRGYSVEAKEAELADLESKIADTRSAQASLLSEANQTLVETEEKTQDVQTSSEKEASENKASKAEDEKTAGTEKDAASTQQTVYPSVDVRL